MRSMSLMIAGSPLENVSSTEPFGPCQPTKDQATNLIIPKKHMNLNCGMQRTLLHDSHPLIPQSPWNRSPKQMRRPPKWFVFVGSCFNNLRVPEPSKFRLKHGTKPPNFVGVISHLSGPFAGPGAFSWGLVEASPTTSTRRSEPNDRSNPGAPADGIDDLFDVAGSSQNLIRDLTLPPQKNAQESQTAVGLPSLPLTWHLTKAQKRKMILRVLSHRCYVSGREGILKGNQKDSTLFRWVHGFLP